MFRNEKAAGSNPASSTKQPAQGGIGSLAVLPSLTCCVPL